MAGRTVWLEHSKGEGTKKRLQGQPGGQCQIPGGLGEGGHMKGFGFISKDDGRFSQTYFAGLSQSMNSRAQAQVLSNHLPFSHSMPTTQLDVHKHYLPE